MQTEVKRRAKSSKVSQRNRKSSNQKSVPKVRYIRNKNIRKDTKRINHPNFVTPLTKNFVDVRQNNINITQNNYISDKGIDYVKFVKDVYPQIKDYLYIFEHELTSKHLDPKEFTLWMINGIDELNQANDLIVFDYNSNTKRYTANLIKDIKGVSHPCSNMNIDWIERLEDNEDTRMLKACIKMLKEDIHLNTYWCGGSEIKLEDNITCIFEYLESDDMDRESLETNLESIRLYKEDGVNLAKDIMNQELDYYKVLEYSESNKKYSKFAQHAWRLVKNNFRLRNYSNYIYNNSQNISSDEPYLMLEQLYGLMFIIDECDPIFWHLDQEFQNYGNEYGAEYPINIIPIENPELEKPQQELFMDFVELFNLLHKYEQQL